MESSYASRLAAEGRAEMARRIVRYVESRPWGARVVGYFPFGPDEGTPTLVCEDALFENSPAMRREFQAFLKTRYGTDAALQEAWRMPAASLDTASPPTDAEWTEARKRWMHWPEPRETRRYRDYFLAVRELLAYQRKTELAAVREAAGRPVVTGTDALKQTLYGWLIRDAFDGANYGPGFRNVLLGSGSTGVGPLLDLPEMDSLITPADYTARSVGFAWEPEGIGDSLVLRGKTVFIEDDARAWAPRVIGTQGAWRNADECRAGLMRNLAMAASRGFIPYWMNISADGFFSDPEVQRIVAEQIPVRRRLLSLPLVPTEHAIAMIIDDESGLDEDFTSGFQNLAVLRQRTDALALSGIPYRVYLLSDLERDDFPVFRAYLLPNVFRLTPARTALIRKKLMRNGSVVVFGPGTGISDGNRLGPEAASELLGFPLELVRKEAARRVLAYGGAHPALADLRGVEVYGDSYGYGPILQPAQVTLPAGVVELGKLSAWWEANRAGLVLKEFGRGAAGNGRPGPRAEGDCAAVFTMAAPVPATVLRSLAMYGGCAPWAEAGDVVAANGNMVAIHTMRPGPRRIHLPQRMRVSDAVTGQTAGCGETFDINLKAPDTQVFVLAPP